MKPKKFMLSFKFAGHGLKDVFKQEQNFRFHTVAAVLTITAGFIFRISSIEWLFITLVIGNVMALELINTAVERTVDLISPEDHPLAKKAKDAGAASVLIFSVAAAVVGAIIFIPKMISMM
ncbi:diacylglycerol kinase family protein [Jeotgalibacillus haloalkalitolerans]|uniref:Diacylglycerol kinase family protein n=1 Tax=Jeotgalibacillus haloalkalitolerans TaxID=3104292 RepID=A0ABU5KLR9_9BACL|nr:diacylglycerol kinase family protein [Jeotgalibacillus sp. HH7-29]MDZ5712205.1 diacylglycerol kinase family protein [Jeotgalibacillus sp. HH7-29]